MSPIPNEIQAAIFDKAAEDHPDDFCAQKRMIEIECAAYLEIQALKRQQDGHSGVLAILINACNEWPNSYQMQLRACQQQLEHCDLLASYHDNRLPNIVIEAIKAKAAQDWPLNLMFRYLSINRQCEAWLAIEDMRGRA